MPKETLFDYIRNGDLHKVTLALRGGASLDERDKNGDSVLHCVARLEPTDKNKKIMAFLKEEGARLDGINNEGDTPFGTALRYGRSGYFNKFLEWRVPINPDGCDLHRLAYYPPNQPVFEAFVAREVDLNRKDPDGLTPVHHARIAGRGDLVGRLLELGVQLEVPGTAVGKWKLLMSDPSALTWLRKKEATRDLWETPIVKEMRVKPLAAALAKEAVAEVAKRMARNADAEAVARRAAVSAAREAANKAKAEQAEKDREKANRVSAAKARQAAEKIAREAELDAIIKSYTDKAGSSGDKEKITKLVTFFDGFRSGDVPTSDDASAKALAKMLKASSARTNQRVMMCIDTDGIPFAYRILGHLIQKGSTLTDLSYSAPPEASVIANTEMIKDTCHAIGKGSYIPLLSQEYGTLPSLLEKTILTDKTMIIIAMLNNLTMYSKAEILANIIGAQVKGMPALHFAVVKGKEFAVIGLVRMGLNPTSVYEGQKPMDRATTDGMKDACRLLEQEWLRAHPVAAGPEPRVATGVPPVGRTARGSMSPAG